MNSLTLWVHTQPREPAHGPGGRQSTPSISNKNLPKENPFQHHLLVSQLLLIHREDLDGSLQHPHRGDANLGRDDIVCNIPQPLPQLRGVGEGHPFQLGDDRALQGRVCVLVAFLDHKHPPVWTQQN